MEVSRDLPDVAQFLFSPNGLDEFLSRDNVIQPSDNLLPEELRSNVIEGPDSKQTIQLPEHDISFEPETISIDNSSLDQQEKGSGENYQNLYPVLAASCNTSSTSNSTNQDGDVQAQISSLHCPQIINSTHSSRSQEQIYRTLSSLVRLITYSMIDNCFCNLIEFFTHFHFCFNLFFFSNLT